MRLFIYFTVVSILMYQLLCVKSLTNALNLLWLLIITNLIVFSVEGFDLVLALISLIYSSVFLLITLLSVHIASYWSPVARLQTNQRVYFIPLIVLCWMVLMLKLNTVKQALNLHIFTYVTVGLFFVGSSLLNFLHIFLYEVFIFESLLLNLYLFFGLITAVLISRLRYSDKFTFKNTVTTHATKYKQHQPLTIRLASSLRRQIRRKNTSFIKFTVF